MPLNPSRRFLTRQGFSLVEMLVVMGIIAILAAVSMVGFSSINRGGGARGAADLAASMALSARVEAMSMGRGALLVIDNGTNTNFRFRRLAVFRKVDNPTNSSQTILQLVGRPTQLQQEVFFLPRYSSGFTTNLTVDFPGAPGSRVFAYEFTPTGYIQDNTSAQDIRMVFSPGPIDADGNPMNEETTAAARAGILLRQNGRPTFFTSPEQMKPVAPSTP